MSRFQFMILLLPALLLPGCKCNPGQQPQTSSTHAGSGTGQQKPAWGPVIVPGGQFVLSDSMMKNMEQHFSTHMYAQNTGDFSTHLDGYYKPMIDRLNKDTLVKYMTYFKDEHGVHNKVISFEITKTNPIVETDSLYYLVFYVQAQIHVEFSNKYVGDPMELSGSVRDKFTTATYNIDKRRFECNEPMKFIGITRKDTLDFHFLHYNYFTDTRLANLIDEATFLKLRQSEQ